MESSTFADFTPGGIRFQRNLAEVLMKGEELDDVRVVSGQSILERRVTVLGVMTYRSLKSR